MIYCPTCGTANREGSRYCNECGAPLLQAAASNCPRCGAANPPDAAHCEKCGLDLHPPQAPAGDEAGPAPAEAPEGPGEAPALAELPAARTGGLPPWLDAVERPDEEAPRPAAAEGPPEPPSDGFEARLPQHEWSPDALPIEPVVGVPYRAHERAELPPSPEQHAAAQLFATAAGEEVHASPQDLPPPHKVPRLALAWRWLIAFALPLALVVPMIRPVGPFSTVTTIPAVVAAAAATIDDLPPGSVVLVVFDYDAALAGELEPIAESYLHQLLAREARILVVSTEPEGAALADMVLDRVLAAYPAVRYGETVLNLGYQAGGEAAIRALATSLATAVPVDYRQGRPLAGFPVMAGVSGARELPLVVILGRDLTSIRRWIEQVGSEYGTPLVAGVPALAEPAVGPYQTAGQLHGVVAGLGGAAAYERLSTRLGPAGQMLASLRTGTWVVAGLLIVVNLVSLSNLLRRWRGA